MITAVDTSILLDVLGASEDFGLASAEALRRCLKDGRVVACPVVRAECTACLPDRHTAADRLGRLRVGYSPLPLDGALAAGDMWRAYRRAGGPRQRMVADFLIGAHALTQADRLLTRDRGFYRRYFEALPVVEPRG